MKMGYKRIILDYHFSEFLSETLTKVDPEDYVRRMKEAGIEAFLVYAKDHWGHVYHKTRISHKHPNAPEDLFGTLLQLCKKNGITPYAYTTIMWDEYFARTHPEWRVRGSDRLLLESVGGGGPPWHFLCINSPYRKAFLQQLDELVSQYDVPAILMDILPYTACSLVCYCDYCRERWRKLYGDDMPEKMDIQDRIRYTSLRDGFYREFYSDVRDVLRRHDKEGCMITHNAGGTDPSLPDFICKETEPFGLDYVVPQVVIKETRNRAKGREVEIYFGRFNQFWDFTVKSPETLRWETVNVFAHNCATTIIDQPLLDGQLDPHAYEAIGWAYADAGRLLEFTRDTSPYAELGVYYDHLNYEVTPFAGHDDFIGACKLMAEWHLPYDLVTDFDNPETLQRFRAIVLPHTPVISEKFQKAIRSYVEKGGTVICDFCAGARTESGPRPGGYHFLINVEKIGERQVNFIKPVISVPDTYLRTGRSMSVTEQAGDEILGIHIPAPIDRNQWVWVSHNTPPGLDSNGPFALIRRFGQGRVLYFAAPLFAEYLNTNHGGLRAFLKTCIERVYTPDLYITAPGIVDAVYQQKNDFVIVTLNVCTLDRGAGVSSMHYGTQPPLHMNINECYPVSGMRLCSRKPLKSVRMLDGAACEIKKEREFWYVNLPAVNGYNAMQIGFIKNK